MTNHPPLGLVDVFAATLPTLEFKPGVHVNYAETVLPMRDGLPKLKDFPARVRRLRRSCAGVRRHREARQFSLLKGPGHRPVLVAHEGDQNSQLLVGAPKHSRTQPITTRAARSRFR